MSSVEARVPETITADTIVLTAMGERDASDPLGQLQDICVHVRFGVPLDPVRA